MVSFPVCVGAQGPGLRAAYSETLEVTSLSERESNAHADNRWTFGGGPKFMSLMHSRDIPEAPRLSGLYEPVQAPPCRHFDLS